MMTAKKKIVTLRDLESIDMSKGSSIVRELEMNVDAVLPAGHAPYAAQFFHDLNIYGLREAYQYLTRFLEEKIPHPDCGQVLKMNRLAIQVDKLTK